MLSKAMFYSEPLESYTHRYITDKVKEMCQYFHSNQTSQWRSRWFDIHLFPCLDSFLQSVDTLQHSVEGAMDVSWKIYPIYFVRLLFLSLWVIREFTYRPRWLLLDVDTMLFYITWHEMYENAQISRRKPDLWRRLDCKGKTKSIMREMHC